MAGRATKAPVLKFFWGINIVKTDEICGRYAERPTGLTLRLLDEEDGNEPSTLLVEGSANALRLLGELLIAVAEEKENESFSISPFGAGRIHFSEAAKLGIYIHRIDDSVSSLTATVAPSMKPTI